MCRVKSWGGHVTGIHENLSMMLRMVMRVLRLLMLVGVRLRLLLLVMMVALGRRRRRRRRDGRRWDGAEGVRAPERLRDGEGGHSVWYCEGRGADELVLGRYKYRL